MTCTEALCIEGVVQVAALACKNIRVGFDGHAVLNGISLMAKERTVTAILGRNGAGKTTLLHILAGTLRSDEGEVYLRTQRIDRLAAWQVARCGIGRLFQDVRIFASLSVLDNILVGFARQKGERLAHALFDRRIVAKQEQSNRKEAMRLLAWVRLEQMADVFAEELSFGQQKLLAIARLLAGDPEVLLLDEPMAGVDPVIRPQIIRTVKELSQNLGKTVLLIEHDIAAVEEIADQVLFIDEGQVIAEGSPKNVLADPTVRMIYLGLSPLSGKPAL